MDIDHLKSLKYSELQKLAKRNGIKANLKADKIIVALLEKENISVTKEETGLSKNAESTNKVVGEKGKRSRKRGRPRSQDDEQVPMKTVVKDVLTPVQKPTPKVRLVTPSSFMTPNNNRHVTTSNRVINMPKSATPHPRKSTGTKTRVDHLKQQSVKSNTPTSSEQKGIETKLRRTSPRIAQQEVTKENNDTQGTEDKKVRRSTFEIQKETVTEFQNKDKEEAGKDKKGTSTNIPRFSAFLANKKKTTSSGKKDWSKVHQKQFEKMESIDDYLARKRKRTDELSSSVKKAKTLTERTKNTVCAMQAYRTPPASANKKLKKPVIPQPSFQSPTVFVPKTTSTKNMNVQFDKSAKSDKTSKTKSVFVFKGNGASARKSVGAASAKKSTGSVSARKSVGGGDARKSLGAGLTPFKFQGTGNTTTPGPVSAKKPVFDLKASLSKPLNYKPYTGKLSDNKKTNSAQAKENIKKPKVKSITERRALAANQRAQKKTRTLNARRGLKV